MTVSVLADEGVLADGVPVEYALDKSAFVDDAFAEGGFTGDRAVTASVGATDCGLVTAKAPELTACLVESGLTSALASDLTAGLGVEVGSGVGDVSGRDHDGAMVSA